MIINVSDLFDAFHEIAAIARTRFGVDEASEPPLSDFLDQLELDLFLPACARRAAMITRRELDQDEVSGLIRLRERDGAIRDGAAGRYQGHGFEALDDSGAVPNEVMAANMLPRSRDEVDLIIMLD
ncbi:hypothetical protein BH23GEM9_BH23GEM9_22020 [soil metagenome]